MVDGAHVIFGVNACVGASAARYIDRLAAGLFPGFLHQLLDGHGIVLPLPAVVFRAQIG